jgi:teichuronic acid biosynthesis glycosyltransferase TuaG
MESYPLISIVTPVYNSAKYLNETIQSVINQTYKNWELLIVDDCSTDNSARIIKEIAAFDPRIRFMQLQCNQGSGPSRNLAIKEANGKYIAFLDSDDFWVAEKLEIQVNFLETNKIAFSHASYGYWDEEGIEIRKPFIVSRNAVDYQKLLKRTEISCLTAIYNQELIGKMYMPNYRRKQDYALWLSILKKGFNSVPQQKVLAYYRQRKGSVTNKKYKLIIKHYFFLRQNEKLSRFNSLKYTAYWIWNGLIKYYL